MGDATRMRTTNSEATSFRTGLVAVLDVGSSKTVCLIGRAEPGNLKVLGAALRESSGIKSATVTSIVEAEEAIRDALSRLMHGRTVVAIAHRLSTVRNFDRIVVLELGKVIQDGAPDALLRRCSDLRPQTYWHRPVHPR